MAQVKFFAVTQAQYDALEQKDGDALYFISDTRRIFKGEHAYSLPVQEVGGIPDSGTDGTIYVSPSESEVKLYAGGRWWDLQESRECTSFTVMPNDEAIPAGSTSYLGETLSVTIDGTEYATAVEIPAGMTHEFTAKVAGGSGLSVDWGDGNIDTYSGESAVWSRKCAHAYENPGTYRVRVFGRAYRLAATKSKNLIRRALDSDCALGRNFTSLQGFCQGALRLTKVTAEDWGMGQVMSLNATFDGCRNLRSVEGFGRIASLVTCNSAFKDCVNMVSCDFRFPPLVLSGDGSADAYRACFYSSSNTTWALTGRLLDFFPPEGFAGIFVDLSQIFYQYRNAVRYPNLTLTQAEAEKLARILWNDTSKTFQYRSASDETGDASGPFRCFTAEVRALIPASWGGTDTQTQLPLPALEAGSWQTI